MITIVSFSVCLLFAHISAIRDFTAKTTDEDQFPQEENDVSNGEGYRFLKRLMEVAPTTNLDNYEPFECKPVPPPSFDEDDWDCNNLTSQVQFLHITKNAGTSIEDWGLEHKQRWGVYFQKCLIGREPSIRDYAFVVNREPWHAPPNHFRENPYDGFDVFMVVRNPYTRVLSEFRCPWTGLCGCNAGALCPLDDWQKTAVRRNADEELMNLWVAARLEAAITPTGGHLIPQNDYVVSPSVSVPSENIILFESLADGFERLMRKKGLWDGRGLAHSNEDKKADFPVFVPEQLNNHSRRMVNDMFLEDFALGNYSILEVAPEMQSSAPRVLFAGMLFMCVMRI